MDGRTICVPLAWYPRLLNATKKQRNNWRIGAAGYGIHWPELDEDISTEGLLRLSPAPPAIEKEPHSRRDDLLLCRRVAHKGRRLPCVRRSGTVIAHIP